MKVSDIVTDKKFNYFSDEDIKDSIKSKAVRGAGATIFAQGANFAINFAATLILARILTPNEFGLVGMVLVFSLLFQNFGMRGFTEVTIQNEKISHKMVSTIFWLHLAISILLSAVFIGMAPLIARFYNEPRLIGICNFISLTFILSALSTQHLALMRRKMQYYRVASTEIISQTLGCVLAIVLALQGWGYWSLVARRISLSLFSALPAWFLCRWIPGLPRKIAGLRDILKFAMNTYGNFAINYCSRHLDYLLIGWKHGAGSLGNYQKAYDLFVLPANQLTHPLSSVFISTLSRFRSEPDRFKNFYLQALRLLSFISMPLSPIFMLTGKDLMIFILGPQWEEAGNIFAAFGVSIGVMVVYGTHGWLHLSLGTANNWFKWSIIEFFTTAVFFLLGLRYGAFGVACGWSASFYVLLLPGLWYGGKDIDLKVSEYFAAMWKFFVPAVLAGVLCYFLFYFNERTSIPFHDLHILLRIASSTLLCGVAYILLVIVFHRSVEPIVESIKVLLQMIPKRNKTGQ